MSTFSFSQVAIIQSLEPGEHRSGSDLRDFINGLNKRHPKSPAATLTDVESATEFIEVVDQLAAAASEGGHFPILHIEVHGWEDRSGLAFADGTSLTWAELAEPLTRLQMATRFNLVVCLAACFGGHFLESLKPDAASPCFALIGPTHGTDGPELVRTFSSFYEKLLTTQDTASALRALLAHQLDEGGFLTKTAEDWFFQLADGYLRDGCSPEMLQKRAGRIIRNMIAEGKPLNAAQVAAILQLGEVLAFSFLDRRFPEFFMTTEIPENWPRFGDSLTKAKQRASAHLKAQR